MTKFYTLTVFLAAFEGHCCMHFWNLKISTISILHVNSGHTILEVSLIDLLI